MLCVRQGNKVIAKNVAIDKNSGLAQTISKKEEENKVFARGICVENNYLRFRFPKSWQRTRLRHFIRTS